MEVTRERLRELYETKTIEGMRAELGGICISTIYNLLDKAGIERKRKMRRNFVKLVD